MRLRRETTFETLMITLGLLLVPGPLVRVSSVVIGAVVTAGQISGRNLSDVGLDVGADSLTLVAGLLMIVRPAFWRRLICRRRSSQSPFYCLGSSEFWAHCIQALGLAILLPTLFTAIQMMVRFSLARRDLNGVSSFATEFLFPFAVGWGVVLLLAGVAIFFPNRVVSLLSLRLGEGVEVQQIGCLDFRAQLVEPAVIVAGLICLLDRPLEQTVLAVNLSWPHWGWLWIAGMACVPILFLILRRRVARVLADDCGTVCGSCGLMLQTDAPGVCPECRSPTLVIARNGVGVIPSFFMTNGCLLFGIYIISRLLPSTTGWCAWLASDLDSWQSDQGWLLFGLLVQWVIAILLVFAAERVSSSMRSIDGQVGLAVLRLGGVFCLAKAVATGATAMFYDDFGYLSAARNAEFAEVAALLVVGFVLLYRRPDRGRVGVES